jgi:hypothetical protein
VATPAKKLKAKAGQGQTKGQVKGHVMGLASDALMLLVSSRSDMTPC